MRTLHRVPYSSASRVKRIEAIVGKHRIGQSLLEKHLYDVRKSTSNPTVNAASACFFFAATAEVKGCRASIGCSAKFYILHKDKIPITVVVTSSYVRLLCKVLHCRSGAIWLHKEGCSVGNRVSFKCNNVLERHRLIWKKIKYQPNSYISFKTCLIYIICKLSMIKMTRSLPYLRIGTVFYFQAFPNRATRVSMRTKSWRYSKSKTV